MSKQNKKYARITQYGDILIPVSLLESFLEEAVIVRTSYVDGQDVITEVHNIESVKIHSQQDIDDAIVQMKLSEESK
jgi:hypothetical protein